ncbi:MAG: hypothetical protein J6P02_05700, partial [Lachnospiraceae bacterium]|nr:hypothetical protein [Lachnospiraceae bacterium]
ATVLSNKLTGVATGSTVLTLTTKEFGGSKSINVTVLPADPKPPTPTPYYPPSGGGGSRGGGGGGGGAALPGANNGNMVPSVTNLSIFKIDTPIVESNKVSWVYDPIANMFKLNIDMDGKQVPAKNVFVTINELDMKEVDGIKIAKPSNNTYFFGENGNMVTGWVKTIDNKWYFFENAKGLNEGKMVTGWKKIGNDWYYFKEDGTMLTSAVTPDGSIVDADGRWIG